MKYRVAIHRVGKFKGQVFRTPDMYSETFEGLDGIEDCEVWARLFADYPEFETLIEKSDDGDMWETL